MTSISESRDAAIKAMQQGMEDAWDMLSLDDQDARDSSAALAHAAMASLEAAGLSVIVIEVNSGQQQE